MTTTIAEAPAMTGLATPCQPWCDGTHANPDFHRSPGHSVTVGQYGAEPPVSIRIITAQARTPGIADCDGPDPRVELHASQNTGCTGLTSMTPAEALATAEALVRAALAARRESAAPAAPARDQP